MLDKGLNLGRAAPGVHVDAVDNRGTSKCLVTDLLISLSLVLNIRWLLKINRQWNMADRALWCLNRRRRDVLICVFTTEQVMTLADDRVFGLSNRIEVQTRAVRDNSQNKHVYTVKTTEGYLFLADGTDEGLGETDLTRLNLLEDKIWMVDHLSHLGQQLENVGVVVEHCALLHIGRKLPLGVTKERLVQVLFFFVEEVTADSHLAWWQA